MLVIYYLICNNITIKLETESMLLWPHSVCGSDVWAQLSLVGFQDSGQKVDGSVVSSQASLGKGLLCARLTGAGVQRPLWCWAAGCSFLLPAGRHPPSVPWGVVLSHGGHFTCSKTVKEQVCTVDSCVISCIVTTEAPSITLACALLVNSKSWVLNQGKGLAAGGCVAGATSESVHAGW